MVLAWTTGAGAATRAPLASLRAVAALTNAQASAHLPVSFEATVTYFRSYDHDLFVEDGNAAIYVNTVARLKLVPGDRVLVRGTTRPSFRPYVEAADVVMVGHGALPKPEHVSFEQMIRGETDCRYVTTRATILSADIAPDSIAHVPAIYLQMLVDGSPADANVDSHDAAALKGLLDAEVQITGAVSGHFDNKMEQTGVLFHVQSLADVKVLRHAGVDPWSLPVTRIDRVMAGYRVLDRTERMRVKGTVTFYQPGSAVVLQDGARSLWIETQSYSPLRIGDLATAIGFPDVQNGFLTLTRSEVRDSYAAAPLAPSLFTWQQLATGGNVGRGHGFDLVSIDGQVVAEVRQATQDEYVLQTNGHLFSAIFRHPGRFSSVALPPLKQIPVGSRVRVTGICMLADANPFNGEVQFDILLRSFGDVEVIARPSQLNIRNLIVVIGLLLILVILVGARSWLLERKVRCKTAALAYLERRRSRILEQINNARPLEEIVEQITEMVSFKLQGAPCWCEIAGGACIGNKPPKITSQQIICEEIAGRAGTALGEIYAAVDSLAKPGQDEQSTLSLAAGLATLAIETSQLYSDLVHRSEYDLLTDVQNRFSLERSLDELMHSAQQSGGVFGLVYIDLNEFKQVNDLYGHQVGDEYLQEVALRMKRQLRPGDVLARLGGDEFAALISDVRSREEVDVIARRLERCFDEPFAAESHVMYGSASIGIALYPEAGDTKDSLLIAADSAMYAAKHAGRSEGQTEEGRGAGELTFESRT